MESLLNRYRNITVLLLVIMAQLVLLAVDTKVKGVPLIRVWAVSAVTPAARVLEGIRGGGSGFLHNYILLRDASAENRRLKAELDKLKLENINLKNDLNTADRARALQIFQEKTPSKTVASTIIATGAGANSHVVFVDRGSVAGVLRGMPVVTPDGIVGKVIQAYPIASEVLLISDPDFAAGVMTQKGVRGNLKGQGTTQCRVDYVPFEDKVEVGEIFYTSGDDRVFPRGFPAGIVKSVKPAQPFKEIMVEPVGLRRGLEDVLILIEGVHQAIPEAPAASQPMYIAPGPPSGDGKTPDAPVSAGTEADRLRAQYKAIGEEQKHNYGENPAGSKAVDFTRLGMPQGSAAPPANAPAAQNPRPPASGQQPAGSRPPTGNVAPVNPPTAGAQQPSASRPAQGSAPAGTSPAPNTKPSAPGQQPAGNRPSTGNAAPLNPPPAGAQQPPATRSAPSTTPPAENPPPAGTPQPPVSRPAPGNRPASGAPAQLPPPKPAGGQNQ